MMNYVWLFLVAIAILVAFITGNVKEITDAAFEYAETSVNIAFSLIGIMALWLGIMKIAEEAGLIRLLARAIRPVSRFLFPQIPSDHPAIGAIVMNLSANWLGLGNAATPMGIKAMEHLQELNEDKDTASNAMIMFLALNTASITLIPMTVIGIRAGLGSQNPAAIIGTTIFASTMATITAITMVKLFSAIETTTEGFGSFVSENLKGILVFLALVAFILTFWLSGLASIVTSILPENLFNVVISTLSKYAIPVVLLIIPVIGLIKKVKVYETFVEGAKEGFQVAIRIIPYLVAILVAIGMLRASGAMEAFVTLLTPLTKLIGMPAEILPAAIMRPLSGSGALGVITELIKTHGPDSFIGQLASTIYGSTETTFYVIAVYFGAVNVKKIRYAIPAGLVADIAGILAAVFICRLMFL
jgi:spore maturation protein SpmA